MGVVHESTIDPLYVISRNIDHQHIRDEIEHDVVAIEHLQLRKITIIPLSIRIVIDSSAIIVDIDMLVIRIVNIVVSADWNFKVEDGTVMQKINGDWHADLFVHSIVI